MTTDDRTRADPLGLTYDKDWEGWSPYQGIVCGACATSRNRIACPRPCRATSRPSLPPVNADCSRQFYTCDASGAASAVQAVPSGTVCSKGRLVNAPQSDCVYNRCISLADPGYLVGQVRREAARATQEGRRSKKCRQG